MRRHSRLLAVWVDARIIGKILVDFAAQADYLWSCNALRCFVVMQDSLPTDI